MFENLQEKLQRAFKSLRGQARLSEENIAEALREIRLALLEADVNFKVVKELIDRIQAKAVGQEVLTALSPGEQVIKIVRDELVETLGKDTARMKFASQPPTVVLMAGLQGSGKTTTSGKLANWFKTGGHRPSRCARAVEGRSAGSKGADLRGRSGRGKHTCTAHPGGGAVGERSPPRGHRLRLRRADRRHRRTSAHRRRSYERDAVAEEAAESIRDSVRRRRHDWTG